MRTGVLEELRRSWRERVGAERDLGEFAAMLIETFSAAVPGLPIEYWAVSAVRLTNVDSERRRLTGDDLDAASHAGLVELNDQERLVFPTGERGRTLIALATAYRATNADGVSAGAAAAGRLLAAIRDPAVGIAAAQAALTASIETGASDESTTAMLALLLAQYRSDSLDLERIGRGLKPHAETLAMASLEGEIPDLMSPRDLRPRARKRMLKLDRSRARAATLYAKLANRTDIEVIAGLLRSRDPLQVSLGLEVAQRQRWEGLLDPVIDAGLSHGASSSSVLSAAASIVVAYEEAGVIRLAFRLTMALAHEAAPLSLATEVLRVLDVFDETTDQFEGKFTAAQLMLAYCARHLPDRVGEISGALMHPAITPQLDFDGLCGPALRCAPPGDVRAELLAMFCQGWGEFHDIGAWGEDPPEGMIEALQSAPIGAADMRRTEGLLETCRLSVRHRAQEHLKYIASVPDLCEPNMDAGVGLQDGSEVAEPNSKGSKPILWIDVDRPGVRIAGNACRLTPQQHRLLCELAKSVGQVVPSDRLAEVMQEDRAITEVNTGSLRRGIGSLRNALSEHVENQSPEVMTRLLKQLRRSGLLKTDIELDKMNVRELILQLVSNSRGAGYLLTLRPDAVVLSAEQTADGDQASD